MADPPIPDEAVVKALNAFYERDDERGQTIEGHRADYVRWMRAALAAALPHLETDELEDKLALREAVNTETAERWRKAEARICELEAGCEALAIERDVLSDALMDSRARIRELEEERDRLRAQVRRLAPDLVAELTDTPTTRQEYGQ